MSIVVGLFLGLGIYVVASVVLGLTYMLVTRHDEELR